MNGRRAESVDMALRRRLAAVIATLLVVALVSLSPVARAASPSNASLTAPGDRVTWTGGPFFTSNPINDVGAGGPEPCGDAAAPGCDRFTVSVAPQTSPSTLVVTVTTANPDVDDYDLYLYQGGVLIGRSDERATPAAGESVAVGLPSGTYEVRVQAFAVTPGSTYAGEAKLVAGGARTFDEGAQECLELVPAKLGLSGVTDDGRRVSVDVVVLVDEGIPEARAREVMTAARRSYDPLGVDLNVTRYLAIQAPSDGTAEKGDLSVGTAEGGFMNDYAKQVMGGVRPGDADVVYTLTNKDIYSPDDAMPGGRDYGLLGLADCIGGVRFDNRAFAVGELGDDLAISIGGVVSFLGNAGAKIASHEIGHLLGAHHHYFDCVEGLAEETLDEREASPCTIMAPFVDLGSINFGVADGAAVRGHAVAYAAENDALAAMNRASAERAAAQQGSQGFAAPGYALLGEDGGIFTFGGAGFFGSTGDRRLNQPVVGMAWTPSGQGYWIVARDGGIFTFGDATFHGSTGGMALNAPILGMESTPTGRGYWLVAADGGIFTFGDADFFGSTGDRRLNAPVVGLGTTGSGRGYWLVAADGGIFTFGDAAFHGSTGDRRLNEPVFDLAATPGDGGYWLVARDGGVFTFGDAAFHGSSAARNRPAVVGLDATRAGAGYWIADRAGTVDHFGDAPDLGDLAGRRLNAPIVGFAGTP
jgi:hypothetical protein